MFMLITKPWVVISEYIHGHRCKYTKPVQLLLVTFVVITLVKSIPGLGFIDSNLSDNIELSTHSGVIGAVWDYLVHFFLDSKMVQEVLYSLIAACTTWIVYLPFGSRRFNLVEYCCAYVYWSSMTNIINVICSPLHIISEHLYNYVYIVWIVVLSAFILFRAFPIKKRWLRYIMLIVAQTVIILLALLFFGFVLSFDFMLSMK